MEVAQTSQTAAPMANIVATAKRLRAARSACRQFLLLWALDSACSTRTMLGEHREEALADPANHDWSLLYRGSVLDD
jgi:hypothetical protein